MCAVVIVDGSFFFLRRHIYSQKYILDLPAAISHHIGMSVVWKQSVLGNGSSKRCNFSPVFTYSNENQNALLWNMNVQV